MGKSGFSNAQIPSKLDNGPGVNRGFGPMKNLVRIGYPNQILYKEVECILANLGLHDLTQMNGKII